MLGRVDKINKMSAFKRFWKGLSTTSINRCELQYFKNIKIQETDVTLSWFAVSAKPTSVSA